MTGALPAPYGERPATDEDLAAVAEVVRAGERGDGMATLTTAEDLAVDWARPGMDVGRDTRVALADGVVVGYADHFGGRAYVQVHPDHHGRGIGSALAAWTEQRAREDDLDQVGQTLPDTAPVARDLLVARGYVPRWDTWVLGLALDTAPGPTGVPDGVALRPLRRPDDDRALYDVVEAAFGTWEDRDPSMAFADWRASWLDRATDLDLVLLAAEGDAVVGACVATVDGDDGWVDQLAVRPDRWGRGIAGALLRESFTRFRDRGLARAMLQTESRTGALGLYLHVGMEVTETFTRWTLPLR